MFSWTAVDFFRAVLLLLFIEGAAYLLFPKHIQGFAMRCLVDAEIGNLRLFGAILIGAGIFLMMLLTGKIG